MNYEKLTPARFQQNLNDQKYKGITGARRAIGKVDWPAAAREKAHQLANKFFSATASDTTVKKAAKKTAPAAKAPKAKAAGVAKTAAKKAAAAPSPEAKRAAKNTAKKAAKHPVAPFESTQTSAGGKSEARANGAAGIITTLHRTGLSNLTQAERVAYNAALADYIAHAADGDAFLRSLSGGPTTVAEVPATPAPPPSTPKTKAPTVTASPGHPQHVALPVGNDPEGSSKLIGEDKKAYEGVQKAGEVTRSLLGGALLPNSSTTQSQS